MKIIPIIVSIFVISIQVYHSTQVLEHSDKDQTLVDFDTDDNYNFGTSNHKNSKNERELYQIYNSTPYQAPILQNVPQIQQIPQTQWSIQQPQYQLNQQPIQYTTQPQTIQVQQQPIIQNQQNLQYSNTQQQVKQQPQQQQVQNNTRLVDNKDTHQERVLHKMSSQNKNYKQLKIKLLKFVGNDRPHYFYQGRHLAQYFCKTHYCSRNLNIYKDNNIKRKISKSQDKRELCQNKCQKIVQQESEYQTKVVYKMKSSPQKLRVLTLFDAIFKDPHFCLNYANDPQTFKKNMCASQKISDEKCGIVASVSMQKACNTKKQIFNFHQALVKNQNLKKKGRKLNVDYSYQAFFKSNKPQCSQCRTRSLQYINQFYTYNKQKRLCSKRFKDDYEKKQACANAMQNQYDRKLQSIEGVCENMCGNNIKQDKRKLEVINHFPKYMNSENQCNSYCGQQSKKVCQDNASCYKSFPKQCQTKCKYTVQKRQLYLKNKDLQTSQLINIYEYFQKVRANYDRENEQQIRQMILYYNRDAIYDAILEMEKQIYKDEEAKLTNMRKADLEFEKKMQIKLKSYYKDQEKAMQNLDNNLNIFDVTLQFYQNLLLIFIIFFIQFEYNSLIEMISENNHNHKSSIKIQLSSNDDQSKTSSDFVSESDTNTISTEYSSKDELNPDDILLQDSQQRNYFLTKVSIVMIFYWGASAALQYHMILNMNLYRKLYWIYKLNSLFWVYLLIFIVFKLTVSLIGDFMRNIQKRLFIIDLFISYFVQIGLYFEVNAYLETMYIWDGHYMVIFIYCMFFNSISFMISTMLQPNKDKYNFFIGFILMEISSFLTMFYFFNTYDIIVMGPTRYQIVYLVISVINFYITYDYSLLLRYRKDRFVETDSIYAFYTQWTNWFSYFWVDLFTRASDIRQKRYKKNYRGNLEAYEEDKDGMNDELVLDNNQNGQNTNNIIADSIVAESQAQIIIQQFLKIQKKFQQKFVN